jgi:hypothetical protein
MAARENSGSRRLSSSVLVVLLAGLLAGCAGDGVDPETIETRSPDDLSILTTDSSPTLISDTVSFWAVRGKDRAAEIRFADSLGQPAGRLLRFEVDDKALDRFPDGRKFRGGDSVLITIRVTDPATLAFDFEPSGLRFKRDRPGKLTVAYGLAIAGAAGQGLSVWMQEDSGANYVKLQSQLDAEAEEITGDVPGFSRYAIAY